MGQRNVMTALRNLEALGITLLVMALCNVDAYAQDEPWRALRINEVIAHNRTQPPVSFEGRYVDMVEIYNTSDVEIILGQPDLLNSIALSATQFAPGETPEQPGESKLWKFRNRIFVNPQSSVVVFCDSNSLLDRCEPHTNFEIANDGSHALTLWGPADPITGERSIIDQVWLPPMPQDVSIGRFPDGAGPAPVPLEEVLTTFVFNPLGTTTFGRCVKIPAQTECPGGQIRRCEGGENDPGGNIEPHVDLLRASTNSPAVGEPVLLTVRVEDEKEPTPPNIAEVQVLYRVDGGPVQTVDLEYDEATGIQHAVVTVEDDQGTVVDEFENPFNIWTSWTGQIPGQPRGALVEFHFRVEDAEGLVHTSPTLCEDLVDPNDPGREPPRGPCHREFGGPDCWVDESDVAWCCEAGGRIWDVDDEDCEDADDDRGVSVSFVGLRYIACSPWFRYKSGYEPPSTLSGLVISEVVASQTNILGDPTEVWTRCKEGDTFCHFDDFLEVHNTSDEVIDLSGLWLSNNRFAPQTWQFPPNSRIHGQEYLIVWLDGDGGNCLCSNPDVSSVHAEYCEKRPVQQPCFWKCPDPTDPCIGEFHTNFSLDAGHDKVYLYDTEERDFGLIHGVEFDDPAVYPEGIPTDYSLRLVPDSDPSGSWELTDAPTPACPNDGACPEPSNRDFFRGDANSDCALNIADAVFILNFLFTETQRPTCMDAADTDDTGVVDLTDAVYLLTYLFLGTEPPPQPGPHEANVDPTCDDDLPRCVAPLCQ